MKVLVAGGRKWGVIPDDVAHLDADVREIVEYKARHEAWAVHDTLTSIHEDHGPISTVIHGYASGADTHGMLWAEQNRVPALGFMARWRQEGKAAGPIRNQRMLDEGKPDLVVTFPGGKGTADMIARARRQGFAVIRVGNGEELPPPWMISRLLRDPSGGGCPTSKALLP